MRYSIWALLVFAELLRGNSALRCYQCSENGEGEPAEQCDVKRCEPEHDICVAMMLKPPEVIRSCSDSNQNDWDGDCLRKSQISEGAAGCKCDSDLCNANCECGVPVLSIPPGTEDPNEADSSTDSNHDSTSGEDNRDIEDTTQDNQGNEGRQDETALRCVRCRENEPGLEDVCYPERCKPGDTYCAAVMLSPPHIIRSCTGSDDKYGIWDGNCVRGFITQERGSVGCRCESDFCNDDCGECKVPEVSIPVTDHPEDPESTADSYYSYKSEKRRGEPVLLCLLCDENNPDSSKDRCYVVECKSGVQFCWAGTNSNTSENIIRGCWSAWDKRPIWDDSNCIKNNSDSIMGCRCESDFCNDDCGCGVPAVSTDVRDNALRPDLTAELYENHKAGPTTPISAASSWSNISVFLLAFTGALQRSLAL